MSNFIKPSNFEASELLYSKVNKNNYNGKFVYLNYLKPKNNPILRVPEMGMPYGLSIYRPNDNQNADPKVSASFSFSGREENKKINDFYRACEAFDEAIIEQGVKNSKEWFGSKKSREVVREFYSPMLKHHPEGKYAPTFKVKLPRRNEKFNCEFYNEDREFVELNLENMEQYFNQGTQCSMLIKAWQVWFAAGKFGVSWEIVQAVVKPSSKLSGVCLIEDSDDEEEQQDTENNVENTETFDENDIVVDSSSDDDSSDVEIEQTQEKKPTAKKRGTRKKK